MGGVGDVMHDLPAAVVDLGWQASVVTPSYGMFHELPGASLIDRVEVIFRSVKQTVDVYDIPGEDSKAGNIVFEHPLFSPQGARRVYCDDEPERPFATDASKFAFFSACAAAWIDKLEDAPDVVHLHDWHTGVYCLLREYAEGFDRLRKIRTVFTIHNLSYQAIRPISGDDSSLESWFPMLRFIHSAIRDPYHGECFNPMATAIRLSDKISTVSPTYAQEICEPSNHGHGFIGGEGLEQELVRARDGGRLVGILNGCSYARRPGRKPGWQRLLSLAEEQVAAWRTTSPHARVHRIAAGRLAMLPKRRPKHVLTSIGRLVWQKIGLFLEEMPDGRTALETVLDELGRDGVLIIVGSGEQYFEERMTYIAERAENLLFLCGYSETAALSLYRTGSLFLMPSTFEPCGISQMLAMRSAQPCVVHGVGGLRDTVDDEKTGFVFGGDTPQQQAAAFVASVRRALKIKSEENDRWQRICIRAASARFSWAKAAQQTVDQLYDSA